MHQLKMLVLTDHSNHSSENSLYELVRSMSGHPLSYQIDVASRGLIRNDHFFKEFKTEHIWASQIKGDFSFSKDGKYFKRGLRKVFFPDYDLIWLRLPPPLGESFLFFLMEEFKHHFIINNPSGIYQTGSKSFLMNFQDICPPMRICTSLNDIIEFKKLFPIVLKPFREYGGKGIIRIDGNQVWDGKNQLEFEDLRARLEGKQIEYLGVKFLKNVTKGDKRIVVVNGKIMGASLRLPPVDSWLCNVAMGGSSNIAEVDVDEQEIIRAIDPVLSKMGIVMYGVDTLVGDDGKRVLSEINTTSIGGLPQIARLMKKPLVKEATDLIWDYITEKMDRDVINN